MKKFALIAAAALLTAPAALAQTANSNPANQNEQSMRQQIQADLQNAGFSDVKVMPESFLVRAKDKSGNPILMVVNPGSETALTTSRSVAAGPGFLKLQTTNDKFSSKLIGSDIYDASNQDIGKIRDLSIGPDGSVAYIVSVNAPYGGRQQHYVAVSSDAVNWSFDNSDKKWRGTMNATQDELKSAPKFNYEAALRASKS